MTTAALPRILLVEPDEGLARRLVEDLGGGYSEMTFVFSKKLKKEADDNIKTCEKNVKSLEEAIKFQAEMNQG